MLSAKDIVKIMKLAKSQNVKSLTIGDLHITYNTTVVAESQVKNVVQDEDIVEPEPEKAEEINMEAREQLEHLRQVIDDEYLDLQDPEKYEELLKYNEAVQKEVANI